MNKMFTKIEAALKGSNFAKDAWVSERSQFESPVHISARCEIHDNCKIGARFFLNVSSIIYSKTTIGKFCTIARNCEIGVAGHPTTWLSTHSFQYKYFTKCQYEAHDETIIGNDVWIGAKAIVGNGVKVGDGAIIAAGSVVTKDIPPYSIVGGVPAKIIRYRFSAQIIERLLSVRWWDIPIHQLKDVDFDNIENALMQIEELVNE